MSLGPHLRRELGKSTMVHLFLDPGNASASKRPALRINHGTALSITGKGGRVAKGTLVRPCLGARERQLGLSAARMTGIGH